MRKLKHIQLNMLAILLFISVDNIAQSSLPYYGSITCKIGGRSWTGNIQTAMYKKDGDYLFLAFETDSSRLEITLKQVKSDISKYIPYKDEIRGDYKDGVDPNLTFFSRYFPDKKKLTSDKAFAMLEADFAVDALSLTNETIKIAFQQTMGKATRRFNPLQPNVNQLQKLAITDANTSEIKFISF